MTPQVEIVILDFGSQHTGDIEKRLKQLGVEFKTLPFDANVEQISSYSPQGLIFTGGSDKANRPNSKKPRSEVLEMGIPILGICYGMQVISYLEGGELATFGFKEEGLVELEVLADSPLFVGLGKIIRVVMAHEDYVKTLPEGFIHTAQGKKTYYSAIENLEKKIYLVQFHPELNKHSDGRKIIRNYLEKICGINLKN
jgi:GMP synthase (glutamine-hydrolysing)